MLVKYLATLKDIFFPQLCFACESKLYQGYLCASCYEKIIFLRPPLCRFCSKPIEFSKTGICSECRKKRFYYIRLISVTSYTEPISGMIHSFKYENHEYLASFFLDIIAKHLNRIGFSTDAYQLLTCVPMNPLKRKERGYNQASILAEKLAKYFKIPFRNDIIYEKELRVSQTKLTPLKRLENVHDAFVVNETIPDQNIVLVDDVFTTGATVNACARALIDKGARTVSVITLANAQAGPRDRHF